MATQSLAPDTLLVQTNLTGSLAAIQDDPDLALGTDLTWLEATSDSSNVDLRVGFPTPAGNLTAGATQTLKTKVRKSAALGTAGTTNLELWEAGTSKVVGPGVAVTDETGVVLTLTFTDVDLVDKTGVDAELRVVCIAPGGSPSNRRVIDVGAAEWDVVYDEAVAPAVSGTAVVAGGGAAAPAARRTASAAGVVAGGGGVSAAAVKAASSASQVAGGGHAVPTGTAGVTAPALSGAATVAGGGKPAPMAVKAASATGRTAGGGTPTAEALTGRLSAVHTAGGGTPVSDASKSAAATAAATGGGTAVPVLSKAATAAAAVAGGGSPTPTGTSGVVAPAVSEVAVVAGGGDLSTHGGLLAFAVSFKQASARTRPHVPVG